MEKLTIVEVSELELEEMLAQGPSSIEKDMQILARQFPTDSGPLDLLGSDTDKVLCIIELKSSADEGQLDQGLRYYDWARTNLEALARHFAGKIDVVQEPKLILIAPSFTQTTVRIAKYVGIPLELKEYACVQVSEGKRAILCKSVEFGEPPGPVRIPTDEVNIGYIENEEVRTFCRKSIEQLRGVGIEVRPVQNFWFSGWYKGKRFFYLGCKKQFFVLEVERPDSTWSNRLRVTNEADWVKALQKEVVPAFSALGGTGLLDTHRSS